MSDSNSVRCPACQARLAIKDSKLRGRKISCPKCKQAFVVPAAKAGGDDDYLDQLVADEAAPEQPKGKLPPKRTASSQKGSPKRSGRRAERPRWLIPSIVGGGLLVVALVAAFSIPSAWFGKKPPEVTNTTPQAGQNSTPPIATEQAKASAPILNRASDWAKADEWLVSPDDSPAIMLLAEKPPAEYTISFNARRLTGKNTFAIGVPIAGRQALVVLDADHGTISGLELLDGKRVADNVSSKRQRLLLPDREVTIRCTVRKDAILCTCNDVAVVDWKGDAQKLSLPPDLAVSDPQALFLATQKSRVAVREIKITAPNPSSSPPLVASAPSTPSSSPKPVAPTSNLWPDVTVLINPSKPEYSTELGPPAPLTAISEEAILNLDANAKQRIIEMRGQTPHAEVLAVDLFERAEEKTHKEFFNQVLDVTGVVVSTSINDGTSHVELRGTTKVALVNRLSCAFINPEPWAIVSYGQVVKIRGRYVNKGIRGWMTDCIVVATGPDPGVVLTTDHLQRAAQDSNGVTNILADRDAVITGTVREIPDDRHVVLTLNAPWLAEIERDSDDVSKLAVGQSVTIKARSKYVDDAQGMKSLKMEKGRVVTLCQPKPPALFDPFAARSLSFATLRKVPALVLARAPLQNPVTVDPPAGPAAIRQQIEKIRVATAALNTTAVEMAAKDAKEREQLQGKWIDVQGIAANVGTTDYPNLIEFRATDTEFASGLYVFFLNPEPFTIVGSGQRVRFRARVDGDALQYPRMVDGVLLEIEPGENSIVAVSAEELARAYTTDAKAAKAKYGDRTLMVTGTVVKKAEAGVHLKGVGEMQVVVGSVGFDDKAAKAWRALNLGSQIRVVGKFSKTFDVILSLDCQRVSDNAK